MLKNKLKVTHLYEEAERRLVELVSAREYLERRLQNAPEGTIHMLRRKKNVEYCIREDPKEKTGKYISKTNKKLIQNLLQKSYDKKVLNHISKEIDNLQKFLKNSNSDSRVIQEIYSVLPHQVKEQIYAIDENDYDYIENWLNISFEAKVIFDDLPVYETSNGEKVRSKSELNIANILLKRGVPYKYECPLQLKNGRTIYPDFTILDIKNRDVVYWEHRGMMDDREYARHSVQRIKDYGKNGIILGKNLIITEETANQPLGTDEINWIIDRYF